MAVASSASSSASDAVLTDLQSLLTKATRATSRALLEGELKKRRATTPVAAPAKPLRVERVEPAGLVFGSISKYAWDQSKKFVKIYVTLAGIDSVPDSQVVCDVQPGALRFEVQGLPPPSANMRLAVTLHSAVDPAQSSWARKADSMLLIKLRKAAEGEEWGSVDESAVQKAKKKAQDLEQNKGKSTAELLSNMYAEADEEGKASLAAAWESGRSKREGRPS